MRISVLLPIVLLQSLTLARAKPVQRHQLLARNFGTQRTALSRQKKKQNQNTKYIQRRRNDETVAELSSVPSWVIGSAALMAGTLVGASTNEAFRGVVDGVASSMPSPVEAAITRLLEGSDAVVSNGHSAIDWAASNILNGLEKASHKVQLGFAIAAIRTESVFDVTTTAVLAGCILVGRTFGHRFGVIGDKLHAGTKVVAVQIQSVVQDWLSVLPGDDVYVHVGVGYSLGIGLVFLLYWMAQWTVMEPSLSKEGPATQATRKRGT